MKWKKSNLSDNILCSSLRTPIGKFCFFIEKTPEDEYLYSCELERKNGTIDAILSRNKKYKLKSLNAAKTVATGLAWMWLEASKEYSNVINTLSILQKETNLLEFDSQRLHTKKKK